MAWLLNGEKKLKYVYCFRQQVSVRASLFLCQHELGRRAGKSITQMLLQEHQMIADGLQLYSFFY